MKKQLLLSLSLLISAAGFGQVTIEECYLKARNNYPQIKQYELIDKSREYTLSNASKGYLPQLMFSAKATYQSDVTELPIDLSQLGIQGVTIPALSKDQYAATVDVTQTVWDGGQIRARKEGIRASAEVESRNVDVDLYALNERVNQLFFGILLAEAQLKQNKILQQELTRNYDQVRSYVQNGIANQADLDAIRVDQLRTEQSRVQFESTRKAYVEMLSVLTGQPMDDATRFTEPAPALPATTTINRPELELFDAQIRSLETKNREITSSLMPNFGLFATGGYGKPGLNMLQNDFSGYYIAGAKLTWNIGKLYTSKNSRRQIQTDIRSVETRRETFLFNTGMDVTQKQGNISNYVDQLKYDDEIIALRTSVKRASEAKMANGTISGTDLTRDINAEQLAMQDQILHRMQLLMAIYNLKFATNN